MEDRPESVSFAVWILNRITTQPTDEEDGRNLADDAFWPGHERAQAIASAVLHPTVGYLGILKMLAFGNGLGRRLTWKRQGLVPI